MRTFKLVVTSPEEVIFQGDVIGAILPGSEGAFEVLANHAPIIATIDSGKLTLIDPQKKRHSFQIGSGFFQFEKNEGILLTV